MADPVVPANAPTEMLQLALDPVDLVRRPLGHLPEIEYANFILQRRQHRPHAVNQFQIIWRAEGGFGEQVRLIVFAPRRVDGIALTRRPHRRHRRRRLTHDLQTWRDACFCSVRARTQHVMDRSKTVLNGREPVLDSHQVMPAIDRPHGAQHRLKIRPGITPSASSSPAMRMSIGCSALPSRTSVCTAINAA